MAGVEIENDAGMEERGIFDAIVYAESHWTKLTSPSLASPADLVMSESAEMDVRLMRSFRGEFGSSFNIACVSVASLKEKKVRVKWRSFLEAVGAVVPLYHMMTLLRLDARLGYTDGNTILVPRVQYLMIEAARNLEGVNNIAATGRFALLDELSGLFKALRQCFRGEPDLWEALKVLTSIVNHFPTLPRDVLRESRLELLLQEIIKRYAAPEAPLARSSAENADRARLFVDRVRDLVRSWHIASVMEDLASGEGRTAEIATLVFLQLEGKWNMLPQRAFVRFAAIKASLDAPPLTAAADMVVAAMPSTDVSTAACHELLARAARQYGVPSASLRETAAAAPARKPSAKPKPKPTPPPAASNDVGVLPPLPASLPLTTVDHVPESYATEEDARSIAQFWAWITVEGNALIRGCRGPTDGCTDGVRGMQLRTAFDAGDEVARFPSNCFITALNALRSPLLAPMLCRSERTRAFCREFSDDGLITMALILEKRRFDEPEGSPNKRPPPPSATDLVSLAEMGDWFAWPTLKEGWWAPYVKYLPTSLDYAGCLDSWSDEELVMLQTPTLITATRVTRDKMERCYNELLSMLQLDAVSIAAAGGTNDLYTAPRGAWQSSSEALHGVTHDEFAWAWHSVTTRCFGVRTAMLENRLGRDDTSEEYESDDDPDYDVNDVEMEEEESLKSKPKRLLQSLVTSCLAREKMQAMVPGLDMLNHSATPTVMNRPMEDGKRAYIQVQTTRALEAGSDFTFNYGAHMTTEMMLQTYGFCLPTPRTRAEIWDDHVQVPIRVPALPLVELLETEEWARYERSDKWCGARVGWFFGTGVYGTGYYRDDEDRMSEKLVRLGAVSVDGVTAVWTSPLMVECRSALKVAGALQSDTPRDFLCLDSKGIEKGGLSSLLSESALRRCRDFPKMLFELMTLSLAMRTLEATRRRYPTTLADDHAECERLLSCPAKMLQPAVDLKRARCFIAVRFRLILKTIVADHMRVLRAARRAIVRAMERAAQSAGTESSDNVALMRGFVRAIAEDPTVAADEAADAVVYIERRALNWRA